MRRRAKLYKVSISKKMKISGPFTVNRNKLFPMMEYLMLYAMNIVKSYELNKRILKFALSLVDVAERQCLLREFYKEIEGKDEEYLNRRTRYFEAHQSVYDADDMAENLLQDIFSSEPMPRSDEVALLLLVALKKGNIPREKPSVGGYKKRVGELLAHFTLGQDVAEVLVFFIILNEMNISEFEDLKDNMQIDDMVMLCSVATGVPHEIAKRELSSRGKLVSCGIFQELSRNTGRNDFVKVEEGIVDFLIGLDETSLGDKYMRPHDGDTFDLASFSVAPEYTAMAVDLLSTAGPQNILLHGTAGTGKTEFARSLAAAVGKKAYFLQYGERTKDRDYAFNESVSKRLMALRVAVNTVSPEMGIIVVDEADYLINTRFRFFHTGGAVEKGVLNGILDDAKAHIVWISNEAEQMEESTLRRFSYSVRFNEFSVHERAAIWRHVLEASQLGKCVSPDLVEILSYEYRVNAGGIASAVRAAEQVCLLKNIGDEGVERVLRGILGQHEGLIRGDRGIRKKDLHKLSGKYDVSALNTNVDAGKVAAAVVSFGRSMKSKGGIENANMNLLFWGMPGTGKTEFAKYIAKEAGLRLIVKRYSDLESMWVGETEKNIKGAFREAEAMNAILFIDEADSFLTRRESAFRSWEVSRTNEVLTQMENHNGILVCCTNLLDGLDRAAMRRFQWKIEFKPLAPAGKLALYTKYFSLANKRLSPANKARIQSLPDLTPGDIKAVFDRVNAMPDHAWTHNEIIDALEEESRYKKDARIAKVGF